MKKLLVVALFVLTVLFVAPCAYAGYYLDGIWCDGDPVVCTPDGNYVGWKHVLEAEVQDMQAPRDNTRVESPKRK